jgi:SAM-dependent methyltransferase
VADPSDSFEVNTVAYDADTLRFYADQAPVYTASGPQGASRHLSAFLDRLQPGSRILELGCGGGRDSELMIRRGFVVDPPMAVPRSHARRGNASVSRYA